jgi:hypothetical protein
VARRPQLVSPKCFRGGGLWQAYLAGLQSCFAVILANLMTLLVSVEALTIASLAAERACNHPFTR